MAKHNAKQIILTVTAILAVTVVLGLDLYYIGITDVNGWIIALLCAIAGLLTAFPMQKWWKHVTGRSNRIVNTLCHTIAATAIIMLLFLGANYIGRDEARSREEKGIITAKYTKERHRKRRVGRNRYVQGEAYTVYFIRVKLPCGREREREVKVGDWIHYKRGDRLPVRVTPGLLGADINEYVKQP